MCAIAHAAAVVAADDAAVRADAGILMSRSMDIKDRVRAAESLARYYPRAAVPVLIEALNETSEPVRRAAARGLWTVARNENPEDAAAARAAIPALRIALGDVSVSVAMNAAEALERLGEPPAALAEARRKALRTAGPYYAYERFQAARGLIGIDAAPALTTYVLDFLFSEYQRLDSSDSSGARDNIRVVGAALSRLVQTRDRNVLNVLEVSLQPDRAGVSDVLRAMAIAAPPPDHFARTLIAKSEAPNPATVAAAYELMAKLDDPAHLNEWVPAAARALADPRRQEVAARALKNVAGKTALGMTELTRLAESSAPDAVRVVALSALAEASDATRARPAVVLAAAKPAALQAYRTVFARDAAGPPFDEAVHGLVYTERDFGRSAAIYLEALKQNRDPAAQARLLDAIAQAHSAASTLADDLRPYANASDPKVRQAATTALDSIKPSWRESGERMAAVASGRLPKPAPPQPGAKGADLAKFYGAVSNGDRAAIARLVNAGNVNAPLVMPNGTASVMTPIGGALQHCGLPQVAPAKVAAVVAQLVALGADPEQRMAGGSTMMDHARAACPPEVQAALMRPAGK
ncbi:MAG: HEAT repeat domain-containing protein [Casimicrobiaceae bacterium]